MITPASTYDLTPMEIPAEVQEGDILISHQQGHATYYWDGRSMWGLGNTDQHPVKNVKLVAGDTHFSILNPPKYK